MSPNSKLASSRTHPNRNMFLFFIVWFHFVFEFKVGEISLVYFDDKLMGRH